MAVLQYNTALLLALIPVKRVGDPACLQFVVGDTEVILRRSPFYQPKISLCSGAIENY